MIISNIKMKRDMDLIREMLLAIESAPHGFAPKIKIQGYTQEEIGYHAVLLEEAGLAKVNDITMEGSETPEAIVERLTWAGHEFLDSARDNRIWNQAKDKITKIGGASLQIWVMVLAGYIKQELGL